MPTKITAPPDRLYTTPHIAREGWLGVKSEKTIKKWIREGKLDAINLRGDGDKVDKFRLSASTIRRFQQAQGIKVTV